MLQTSCELVGGELVKFYHTKKAGVKKVLAMLKKGMDTKSFRVFLTYNICGQGVRSVVKTTKTKG